MSDIKIIEKQIAPTCCWATIKHDPDIDGRDRCVYKVVFDRAYPYFWIAGKPWDLDNVGVALTSADIERAAATADTSDSEDVFDLTADGILHFPLGVSCCVAVGARKAFYLLLNPARSGKIDIAISAQEDAVCPFNSEFPG